MAVPKKYEHIDLKPPQAVANAAEKGLEYRRETGKGGLSSQEAGKEGIGSGVQRAVNLKNRNNLTIDTIKMMRGFFSRHEKNKGVAEGKKPQEDAGHVAWLLWGGDPGKKWVDKILKQMEEADMKEKKEKEEKKASVVRVATKWVLSKKTWSNDEVAKKTREVMEGNTKKDFINAVSKVTGVSKKILNEVHERGARAWQKSHTPGVTQVAWARARVYSFVSGGTTQKTTDNDLWREHSGGDKKKASSIRRAQNWVERELRRTVSNIANKLGAKIEYLKVSHQEYGSDHPKEGHTEVVATFIRGSVPVTIIYKEGPFGNLYERLEIKFGRRTVFTIEEKQFKIPWEDYVVMVLKKMEFGKTADLNPALGISDSPCDVMRRINQEVPNEKKKDKLLNLVEQGHDLKNSEAHIIYSPLKEKGFGKSKFKEIMITPHAQYRMDLRGIEVKEILGGLFEFQKIVQRDLSQKGWSKWETGLDNYKVAFTTSKGLKIVFEPLFERDIPKFKNLKGAIIVSAYYLNQKAPPVSRTQCRVGRVVSMYLRGRNAL